MRDPLNPEGITTIQLTAPGGRIVPEDPLARPDQSAPPRPCVAGYEVLEELGRGGMGVVYKARQISLNRLVALKMILAGGHAGQEELARFRSEAEAVARLQHPGIVQIHEVGEAEGRPFFSLEFVAGSSLAAQVKGTPQPAQAAARLVEVLARAIQAAHERGIIHRDLKPANVLLTADGQPKITDFGLAKFLDGAPRVSTQGEPGVSTPGGQTQSGAILGTPSYMAPEQAAGKSGVIGPAADIYALGAIGYELLTGRPPFVGETPLDTVLQVLAAEPVPPRRLQPRVPRDLETICLKCLHKDPRKRYASALDLAEDLHRFQAGEPIAARPTPAWERALLWTRRRPAVAALLGACAVALTALLTVILVFNVQLQDERDAALQAKHDAEHQRDQARQAREQALINFKLARKAVDDYSKRVSDDPRLQQHGLEELQREWLQSAEEFYQEFIKQRADDPAVQAERARAYERLADITDKIGSKPRALKLYRQALAIQAPLVRQFPAVAEYQQELVTINHGLAALYKQLGRQALAEQAEQQAHVLLERLVRQHPAKVEYRDDLATSYNNLALFHKDAGRFRPAEEGFQKALAIFKRLPRSARREADRKTMQAVVLMNLGGLYRTQELFLKAEKAYRQALALHQELAHQHAREHRRQQMVAFTHINLALLYSQTRRTAEAEKAYLQAQAIFQRLVRAHPAVTSYQNALAANHLTLGALYFDLRRLDRCEKSYQAALAIQLKLAGDHPRVDTFQTNLASAYMKLIELYQRTGQSDRAEELLNKFIALNKKLVRGHPADPDHQAKLAFGWALLGNCFDSTQRPAEAETAYQKALALREQLARTHPQQTQYAVELGGAYCHLGYVVERRNLRAALPWYQRALATLDALLQKEPNNPDALNYRRTTYSRRSDALARLGRLAEAVADREQVVASYAQRARQAPRVARHRSELADQQIELARLCLKAGRPAQAETAYQQAEALLKKLLQEHPGAVEYQSRLASCYTELSKLYLYHTKGRAVRAEAAYQNAVALRQRLASAHPGEVKYAIDLGGDCCNLASILEANGKRQEALAWYQRAAHSLETVLKKEIATRSWLTTARKNLRHTYAGQAHVLKGLQRGAESVTSWEKVLAIQEQLVQASPADSGEQTYLAEVLGRLGSLYRQADQGAKALRTYRKAVAVLEKLAAAYPNQPDYQHNLACCHVLIGRVHQAARQWAQATAALRQAVTVREQLVRTWPRDSAHRNNLAETLQLLGYLEMADHQLALSRGAYQKALALWEQLSRDQPQETGYRIALAKNQADLAWVDLLMKDLAAATAAYRQAAVLWDQLAATLPAAEAQAHLDARVDCHHQLAGLYLRQAKWTEAEAAYRRTLALREELIRQQPRVLEHIIDQGGSWCNLGHVLRGRKQLPAARDAYARAARLLEDVLQKAPRQAVARAYLCNTLFGRATTAARLKCYREALADWDRVLALCEQAERPKCRELRAVVLARLGEHALATQEGNALAGLKDVKGGTLYNLACVFALSAGAARQDAKLAGSERDKLAGQYALRAIELLARARTAGYFKDPAKLANARTDTDLDSLRAREEFKHLLSQLEKDGKKEGK